MNEKERTTIQALCLEKKAIGLKYIDPKSIAVDNWVRYKCQYGCGAYGKNLCCPPHSPTPEETKKIIAGFNLGVLVHFGGDVPVTKAIVEIEREIFLNNHHKVVSFGAGPCKLCKECSFSKCQHPKLARPSMEACGIDVYTTARNNDFPINVVASRDGEQNYFGLLLIE